MFKFDWTGFNPESMKEANESRIEDEIFGAILVEAGEDETYLIDIHHSYYSSMDKYFDLEVYEAIGDYDEGWYHGEWFGSIQDIQTATNYKRFCKRAENLIIKFLNDLRIANGQYDVDFEVCIDESMVNEECLDEWGCAFMWINDEYGVEYNFCIDDGVNYSALYKMDKDDEGYADTDTSTFVHYEIDFGDKDWEKKLVDAMRNAILKFFNLERR